MDIEAQRRRADCPATAVAVDRVVESEARIDVARIVSDAVAGSSVMELLQ